MQRLRAHALIEMDLPLPCPLDAGWELVRTIQLPRLLADGLPLGGFSAASSYQLGFLPLLSGAL